MGTKVYKQRSVHDDIRIFYRSDAIKIWEREKKKFKFFMFLTSVFVFISPILSIFIFFIALGRFYKNVINEFFRNDRVISYYNRMLKPQSADKVFSIIGYRVEIDDMDSHIELCSDSSKLGELAEKQKKYMAKPETHVGLDHKLLTTHMLLIGKTGAGKTEAIRSIANDTLKNGGGFLFTDGKSDDKMLKEFQIQAKGLNRETSSYVLNFLKAEYMAESNTFNPIAIMHPVKAVEFLGSLAGGGGGDGNHEYFFQRGKAMLLPIVSAQYLRAKLYDEGYDFDKIVENTEVSNIPIVWTTFYCMCRDINEIIKNNIEIKAILDKVAIIITDENFRYLESLVGYITLNPTKKSEIEQKLKMEYRTIKEIYYNVYKLLRTYYSQVWNQSSLLIEPVAKAIYVKFKQQNKNFYSNYGAMVKIDEIKKAFNELKEKTADEQNINKLYQELGGETSGLTLNDYHTLHDAFHRKKMSGGNIFNPPEDAIQQHAYAQQQWTTLFSVFTAYKHIFGQTNSDIDPRRLLSDNKFLYTLVPILELDKSQVEILGKIIIMTIKEVTSISLGGKKFSLHNTLMNIAKDKITPKPFTLCVLDEYGSYPVEDVDKLLMQIRSLNMSAVISVQNAAHVKAGSGEKQQTSKESVFANSSKFFLKLEDDDTIKWLETMLPKREYESRSREIDAYGNVVESGGVEIKEKHIFDPTKMRDLDNGFGVLFLGADDSRVIPVQSFYRGGKVDTIHIKKYENIF